MSREIISPKYFFDHWIEETSIFIQCLLGKHHSVGEIFEEAILALNLSFIEGSAEQRFNFWEELEEIVLNRKIKSSKEVGEQLELFHELTSENLSQQYEVEVKVCRARAFLFTRLKTDQFGGDMKNFENITIDSNLLVEFANHLQRDEFISDPIDLIEQKKIAHFLLGSFEDEEASTVEKMCRQNSQWQSEKTRLSKMLGWMRRGIGDSCSGEDLASLTIDHNLREKIFLRWKEHKDGHLLESFENEKLDSSVSDKSNREDLPNNIIKSPVIAYLAIGVIALMVGYFGWIERESKNEEVIHKRNYELVAIDQNNPQSEIEDWVQVAQVSAMRNAQNVLAEKTTATIKEMEKQIVVPPDLLPSEDLSEFKSGLITQSTTSVNDDARNKNLMQVLHLDKGYLFLPNKEALGRVIHIKRDQRMITFERADWHNRKATYGLPVADYELRIGTEESGYLIISGEIKRQILNKKQTSPNYRYEMKPEKAWWLDLNQTRLSLSLKSLFKE